MERIQLKGENIAVCAIKAAEVLRAGGVVLYPTDTLYGLGADAFSDKAFEKVCTIKDRDERRPIHAVFADLVMAEQYADISPLGRKLADSFLPGPLTLVFKKKDSMTTGIAHNLSTIGVRIPKNEFCLALAHEFGKPFTTTSANMSGSESPATLDGILAQLEQNVALIDLAIDGGTLPSYTRSTVVDVREQQPHVLREGVISAAEISKALEGGE
ncbi:MAG: threonylcarbamoyl-AMP synthase [Parcubacteria group bacterium RIFCSPHIGHO2_01_FULL_56_18]|nr:MAG: threonylcarbamoyl-AMP synthase [Parcubacteria group bacterium RIFCSPHIGHO2_01_FULL_56_18]